MLTDTSTNLLELALRLIAQAADIPEYYCFTQLQLLEYTKRLSRKTIPAYLEVLSAGFCSPKCVNGRNQTGTRPSNLMEN
jgi:hypothetical protein